MLFANAMLREIGVALTATVVTYTVLYGKGGHWFSAADCHDGWPLCSFDAHPLLFTAGTALFMAQGRGMLQSASSQPISLNAQA